MFSDGGRLQLKAGRHTVWGTPLAGWLSGRLRLPVITYYHEVRKVWVAAHMIDRVNGVVVELGILGSDPENPDPGVIDTILYNASPEAQGETYEQVEALKGSEGSELEVLEQWSREMADMQDCMRRHCTNGIYREKNNPRWCYW